MALSFAMLAIVIINILLAVAVLAGVIVFEVWLSRRQSRWPGLIMPILSFALSLLLVLGNVAFMQGIGSGLPASGTVVETTMTDAETGALISHEVITAESDWTLGDTVQVGLLLLIANIPTLVLLGVYYAGREKLRRDKLLEKMHIQDL